MSRRPQEQAKARSLCVASTLHQRMLHQQGTWWMLGTSTMSHLAYVIGRERVALWAPTKEVHFERPRWAWREKGRNERNARTVSCLADPNAERRLCYVPVHANPAGKPDNDWAVTSIPAAISLLRPQMSSSDVIIVQIGPHFMGHGVRAEADYVQLTRDVAKDYARDRLNLTSRLIWLQEFAQHFPTANGTFSAVFGSSCRRKCTCVPLRNGTVKPQFIDDAAAHLRSAGIPVLDTWTLTRTDSDNHPNSAYRSKSIDCTHYCLFAGVYTRVLQLIECYLGGDRSPAVRELGGL